MNEWIISKITIIIMLIIAKIVVYFKAPFAKDTREHIVNQNTPNEQKIKFEYTFNALIESDTLCAENTTLNIKRCVNNDHHKTMILIYNIIFYLGIFSYLYYLLGLVLCKKLPGRLILVALATIGLIYELYTIIYIVETGIDVDTQGLKEEAHLEKQPGYYLYIVFATLLQLVIIFMPGMNKCEKENDIIKL